MKVVVVVDFGVMEVVALPLLWVGREGSEIFFLLLFLLDLVHCSRRNGSKSRIEQGHPLVLNHIEVPVVEEVRA